mgnify:CR=1 FL=1|tara:strand:+ start:598 stop:1515 length:918 start_codon:yes stop_codon:yes gene_type:complete
MNKDIRDIFFDNIKNKFLKDKKIFILTNDADVYSLQKIKDHKRFIDAGVAEQNLINIAAGLSHSINKSLVYGFCTFLTFRCYEQLKFNVGSHNLNCKIVGVGPGYSFSNDGPTHHGIQDLYLMYLIPEFEIFNIADNNLANQLSKDIFNIPGPIYVRLDKGILNYNSNEKYDLKKGFKLIKKNQKNKNLIITSGYFNKIANDLSDEMKNFDVLNLFRLKNFYKPMFINTCKKYENVIIYDENTFFGGITPIIQSIFHEYKYKPKLKIICSPDKQLFKYTKSRNEILKLLKLDKLNLKKQIHNIFT